MIKYKPVNTSTTTLIQFSIRAFPSHSPTLLIKLLILKLLPVYYQLSLVANQCPSAIINIILGGLFKLCLHEVRTEIKNKRIK
ncbi:MAG: hypothetical protein GQ525_06880 [Draconibacterium sp.]|nr:hypothetical protein [Draconibacterium sp.]